MLRERLEPLMLEAIRQSKYTNNVGTRLLVRSRDLEDEPFKYQIEYIQAALSMEKKLVVMLYDDGHLDMHNIAIERCFRHIAIGRRNWLHTGSHQSALLFGFCRSWCNHSGRECIEGERSEQDVQLAGRRLSAVGYLKQ